MFMASRIFCCMSEAAIYQKKEQTLYNNKNLSSLERKFHKKTFWTEQKVEKITLFLCKCIYNNLQKQIIQNLSDNKKKKYFVQFTKNIYIIYQVVRRI